MSFPASPQTQASDARGRVWLAASTIVAGTLLAYRGSLSGPFLFDDRGAILENPTIGSLFSALRPPRNGLPVSGRPLVNFTFALNHVAGGAGVWGYHAFNLSVHLLAALTLFGVARRTLRRVRWTQPGEGTALGLGAATALLWAVHPLATEAVTYITQRSESLVALFYLLTLYCFIRYAEGRSASANEEAAGALWAWLSIICCLFGMATKEVMVTAPVLVLFYDRTFASGSFAAAWRRRKVYYLGLGATWIPLGFLVLGAGGRGGTAGFGAGVPWWAYALTQFRAVAHYLRLCFWPHPLIGDYGRILGGPPAEIALDAAVVICVAGVSIFLMLRRRSALGFLGVWFFLVLAPSSSVVPVATEIIAERRAYLSLAAVVALVVCGAYEGTRRLGRWLGWRANAVSAGAATACLLAAAALGIATATRNRVYLSPLAFWSDAVQKVPDNAGARNNLGNVFAEQGRLSDAIVQYQEALRLVPDYADAHHNLGNADFKLGRTEEAIEHYRVALRFRPNAEEIRRPLGIACYRLANSWAEKGEWGRAAELYRTAVEMRPDFPDAHVNYGNVLAQLGHAAEAVREVRAALALEPGAADVRNNLGGLLAESGRLEEAKVQFQEALRLQPNYREARDNLARVEALEEAGRP